MKTIKAIYNNDTQFIEDIINNISQKHLTEFYNVSFHKDKSKAYKIMERYGTKNFPLVVFADENLDEYAAIWSERNPDWSLEINKVLGL